MAESKVDRIKTFIHCLQKTYQIPGVSVAIVHQGDVILADGFGVTDLTTKQQTDARTRFCIGSITKSFTATLLAKLLPFHGFTWDTPLKKIFAKSFPDFHFADEYISQKACLRDLLAHKMGIELGNTDFPWMCNSFTRDTLPSKMEHVPLSSIGFRVAFEYNNLMYAVAGRVVEELTGTSWEDAVSDIFFHTLNMEHASFIDLLEKDAPQLAKPHMFMSGTSTQIDLDIHRSCECVGPAASVCCSAEDMVKWMQFLLDEGRVDGTPVVPTNQLRECWKAQFTMPNYNVLSMLNLCISQPQFPVTATIPTYGLGFDKGTYRGFDVVGHAGELFGYDCLMTLYPDMNLGIYTAFNGPGGENGYLGNMLLRYYISDCMLGLTAWLNTEHIETFPEPWAPRKQFFIPRTHSPITYGLRSTRPLEDYAGTYTHGLLGEVCVEVDQAAGVLVMHHGKTGQFQLHSSGEEDEFRLEGTGPMSFVHRLDLYAPTGWMMVKFSPSCPDILTSLIVSFYESSPVFTKSN